MIGLSGAWSKSQSCRYPSKFPVARFRSASPDAPKVPHLNDVLVSSSFASLTSFPDNSYIWMQPVARA
eukprot:31440-Pelagococcus_subviridis.AAC.25